MGNKSIARKGKVYGNRFISAEIGPRKRENNTDEVPQQPSCDVDDDLDLGLDVEPICNPRQEDSSDSANDLPPSAKKIKYFREAIFKNDEDSEKYFLLIDFSVLKEIVSF